MAIARRKGIILLLLFFSLVSAGFLYLFLPWCRDAKKSDAPTMAHVSWHGHLSVSNMHRRDRAASEVHCLRLGAEPRRTNRELHWAVALPLWCHRWPQRNPPSRSLLASSMPCKTTILCQTKKLTNSNS